MKNNIIIPAFFASFLTACSYESNIEGAKFLDNILSHDTPEIYINSRWTRDGTEINYDIDIRDVFSRMSDEHVPEVCLTYITRNEKGKVEQFMGKPQERCL